MHRGRPKSATPPKAPEPKPPKGLSPEQLKAWKCTQRVRKHRFQKYTVENSEHLPGSASNHNEDLTQVTPKGKQRCITPLTGAER